MSTIKVPETYPPMAPFGPTTWRRRFIEFGVTWVLYMASGWLLLPLLWRLLPVPRAVSLIVFGVVTGGFILPPVLLAMNRIWPRPPPKTRLPKLNPEVGTRGWPIV